jgi:hypothetical protein
VVPQSGCVGDGAVPIWCEFLDELVERSQDAGFFQAVHSLTDFDVGVIFVVEVDVVFGDYFGGYVFSMNSHVLEVAHWDPKIIVGYVHAEVAGSFVGVRDDAVEVHLGVEHGDGGRACVSWIVEFVATDSAAHAVGFLLVGADAGNEVCISDLSVETDLAFCNEKTCVGAFDFVGGLASVANSLKK